MFSNGSIHMTFVLQKLGRLLRLGKSKTEGKEQFMTLKQKMENAIVLDQRRAKEAKEYESEVRLAFLHMTFFLIHCVKQGMCDTGQERYEERFFLWCVEGRWGDGVDRLSNLCDRLVKTLMTLPIKA